MACIIIGQTATKLSESPDEKQTNYVILNATVNKTH